MADPVRLADLTTVRLGGPAADVVEASDEQTLVDTVARADADGVPVLVVAGGSNLVVADGPVRKRVVLVRTGGFAVDPVEDGSVELRVAAGENWDALVNRAVRSGWAGVEALSGIPGSVGATPVQNVGAYGQEVADTLAWVRTWDRVERAHHTFAAAHCGFGYRTSRFKREPERWLVLEVGFRLPRDELSAPVRYGELARRLGVETGGRRQLDEVRQAVLELRRAKGMVLDAADHDTWSTGSFFTNPVLDPAHAERLPLAAPRWRQPDGRVKTSAAWLIEQAGIAKGHRSGAARISSKHPLALTNSGGASTGELLMLAREVRDRVRERFDIELVNEPVLVGCSL